MARKAPPSSLVDNPVSLNRRVPPRAWLLAAVLWLLTVALYWPATRHDFLPAYDDDVYVTANTRVQQGLTWANFVWALHNPVCSNWHPVTVWSHMLDCQVYGLHPWGHHLTNVLLHATNAVLLLWLLWSATGACWRSAVVAALFAWHPLHVESVAWVAERKDVLSAFFGFLALIFYVRHARARPPTAAAQASLFWRSPWYWLAWLCFGLGLLSKPMLVTWPVVLLLLDFWPLGRLRSGLWRTALAEKIPFVLFAGIVSVVTFWVQSLSGAVRTLAYLSWDMRLENAAISYCRYLGKLFWPADLAALYPIPPSWPVAQALAAAGFLAGVTGFLWRCRRRQPSLLMGWCWFLVTLAPVIGLVQVGVQAMADRYSYIPSVGVSVLAVWGLAAWFPPLRARVRALALATGLALLLCAALTERQIGYWRDDITLFQHSLNVTPDNDTARNILGVAFLDDRQTNAAVTEFQTALRLNSASVEAHERLGTVLARQGDTPGALREYQEALRYNPGFADGRYRLGNLFARLGRNDEAIDQFLAAAHRPGGFAEAENNVGILLAAKGKANDAIAHLREAVRLKPDYVDAHYNLANELFKSGDMDRCIGEFQTVIQLAPDRASAHYFLSVALARQGQAGFAIRELQETLRLQPDNAIAHDRLGALLGSQDRLDEAIGEFQAALRLKPDYAEASNHLVQALHLKAASGR